VMNHIILYLIMKKALILGITGQIGTYLLDKLLARGYEVYGVARQETYQPSRDSVHYICCDIRDYQKISSLVIRVCPDEIYNLASPTNLTETIKDPIANFNTNIIGLVHLCETIKTLEPARIKLFNATSSEMFRGHITNQEQEFTFDEKCNDFHPISPYGISKVAAYWTIRYYRENFGLPFWTGVLCNISSPHQRPNNLLPKVVQHVKYNTEEPLKLGNLDLYKDFTHASDIAEAIHMIMTSPDIKDYVISSGQVSTIRHLIELVYQERDIILRWDGEEGYDSQTGHLLVHTDPCLRRSFEKDHECLVGKNNALKELGWSPLYNIKSLIHQMYTTC
jgi:GDPmannose 4,6-dehydratase